MDDLVTQSGRDGEGSSVDYSSGRSGRKGARMTNVAPHLVEKRIATHCSRRNRILPARSPCGSHEVCEGQHIAAIVFRIGDRIEWRSRDVDYSFSRARRILVCTGVRGGRASAAKSVELIGNPHLIEIGIAGERQKTAVLGLPAETSKPQRIICFGYGNGRERAALRGRFGVDVVLQVLVGDTLDKSIAERLRDYAESSHVLASRDVLDHVRIRTPSMD